MFQDKVVTNALLAALSDVVGLVERAAFSSVLGVIREERARSAGLSMTGAPQRSPCGCMRAEKSSSDIFPRLRPVIGVEGQDVPRILALPVFYIAWQVEDYRMSGLEIVEIPLLTEDAWKLLDGDFDKKKRWDQYTCVRCLSDVFNTSPMLTETLLEDARQAVMLEYFDKACSSSYAYLSVLDCWPKESLSDLPILASYFSAHAELQTKRPMEFHERRILLSQKPGQILPLSFNVYAVNRSDLRFLG